MDRAPALARIRERRDFLAAARARRSAGDTMVVQARNRRDDAPARVGFTCSKKVGNAVTRNRAKRRLRAAADQALAPLARAGWDYVLIGRADATTQAPFPALIGDLTRALERLHRERRG